MQEFASPFDYGAVADGIGDDTAAIQSAINFVHGRGGGTVTLTCGATYRVTGTLIIGTAVSLNLNGAKILMDASNIPIIEASKDALTQRWLIQGPGTLEYATQQSVTQTGAVGIKLSKGGVNSFNFVVSGPISIDKANTGIGSPPESGCFVFDGVIDNIVAYRCSNWGSNIDCDASTGGGTNMNIRNLWALQASGSELPESKGHRVRAMVGLRASNLIGDHLQKEWLYLESCSGEIGHLHFESCDASASTGQLNLMTMAACPSLRIGEIYGYENNISITGDAECYVIRPDGMLFDLHTIRLLKTSLSDTSSGAIYTVNPTAGTRVRNEVFVQTDVAGNPVNANLADFGIRKKILRWNGQDRMRVTQGGAVEVFTTAAPTSEAWTVGDKAWNTALSIGQPIGWVCVTDGTPGTWGSFGNVS